jgi:hypothetical protein
MNRARKWPQSGNGGTTICTEVLVATGGGSVVGCGAMLQAGRSRIRIPMKYVRFEVSTAVTMNNVAFWDIKLQFVPHRRHITSPLQSPAS